MASCFLTQYQTLIVGLLGFTGVILTLLTNARLNRKQHARQIEHERTALKAALSTELSIIRDTFRDRLEMIGEPTGSQGMWVPLDTMTDVYGRVLDKIGCCQGNRSIWFCGLTCSYERCLSGCG